MTRSISDDGLELLKTLEGLRLKAYKDVGGVLTIGYGTTDGVYEGQVITKEQAHDFLMKDLEKFEDCVFNSVRVKLTDNMFSALCIFAYNIGEYAFKNSTLLKVLNQGKYDEVPTQLARWNKVNGIVVQGLVNRRNKEIELWRQTTPTQPKKWYSKILNLFK